MKTAIPLVVDFKKEYLELQSADKPRLASAVPGLASPPDAENDVVDSGDSDDEIEAPVRVRVAFSRCLMAYLIIINPPVVEAQASLL